MEFRKFSFIKEAKVCELIKSLPKKRIEEMIERARLFYLGEIDLDELSGFRNCLICRRNPGKAEKRLGYWFYSGLSFSPILDFPGRKFQMARLAWFILNYDERLDRKFKFDLERILGQGKSKKNRYAELLALKN